MNERPTIPRPRRSLLELVRCAFSRRCPRCQNGPLFQSWYSLHKSCPSCERPLNQAEGSTWFFMYASSGGVVGIAFFYMLFFPPASAMTGWFTVVPVTALVLFITLPFRKAFAIAFDYYLDPDS